MSSHFVLFFHPTDNIQDHIHVRSNKSFVEESVWDTMDKQIPGQQQSNLKAPHGGSRKKRFLSYPRFVELMVTADAKMARHHGHNLEHFILTVISVVSKFLYLSMI